MKHDVEQARRNLPLPRLMEQHGDFVAQGRSVKCPFCESPGKKKSATLSEKDGRWWFKCFSSSCRSATNDEKGAWDEVGYLAWKLGLPRNDAFKIFLKEAGVWREPARGEGPAREQSQNEESNLPDGSAPAGEAGPDPVVTPGEEAPAAEALNTPPPKSDFEKRGEHIRSVVAEASKPEGVAKSLQALREFYGSLNLTEADIERIWEKRGLPRSACDAFGFRSSSPANEQIIRSLVGKYSEEDLVLAGLLRKEEKKTRPQPQFCGYGNTGKKDEKGELIWGTVNPILIPYFDEEGELIGIRPHKGNIPGQKARVFIAAFRKGWKIRPAENQTNKVVTEGEFKACALYWAFQGKMGVAALPGIQQSKNYTVMEELKSWLWGDGRSRPNKIVVAFDNEEKGDPKLPGFKPDKRKRFDSIIWARFLATSLKREFGRAMVAQLPNEWRDSSGKADWDGRMAAVVKAHSGRAGE